MTTQTAIVMQGDGKATVVKDRSIPQLRPGFLLVETKAVAINPTDWKHVARMNTPGCVSGCDYAGIVAETGTGYEKQWKKGDRICGGCHGGNSLEKEDGSFAQYIVAKADVQMRIPDNWSFEEASTLGVAILTVGQGLYQKLGLQFPDNPIKDGEYVFIYGGSSAMGTMGLQFARLSGYKPITTCSPKNFELVKSMGAIETWDYKDPEVVAKINKYTGGNLKIVWDTIGTESSVKICEDIIADGGEYSTIARGNFTKEGIKISRTLAYSCFGEAVSKSILKLDAAAAQPDFEWAKKWVTVVEPILAAGKIKPHPPKVGKGFDAILEGMELMKADKVSGNKLVYTLD